jgi:hypothetical protein
MIAAQARRNDGASRSKAIARPRKTAAKQIASACSDHLSDARRIKPSPTPVPLQTNPDCCGESAADIVRWFMWKRFHSSV